MVGKQVRAVDDESYDDEGSMFQVVGGLYHVIRRRRVEL